MKYSLDWIQRHIDGTLPRLEQIVSEITEKAFEIEGTETHGSDTILEIKVLPNRAHDALSHRGMAREIAALFGLKRKDFAFGWPKTDPEVPSVNISLVNPEWCPRYIGVRVDGVEIKESPKWLRERLEAVGQRSINALVDVTNFVMFDIGQPIHAFDARKLKGGITVRLARKGETMTTLDNKELLFDGTELVIADDEGVLALAGVKGGKRAEVDTTTTSIVLECANFHPTRTRQTSVKHNIRTDASKRYENGITSRLAEEGAKEALGLLLELFPEARVAEPTDKYPRPEREYTTGVSAREVRTLLGVDITERDIADIFSRSGIQFELLSPREHIVYLARTMVGKTYRRGASVTYDAPSEFDCSSLVSWLYKEAGYSIPRISVDQFAYARPISERELLPGDLVFANTGTLQNEGGIHFSTREWMPGTPVPGGIDHVGVFIGEGEIIHATSFHGRVVQEKLAESAQFSMGRRYGRIIGGTEERFVVQVPPERLDLRRPEDLIEEIGRNYGYNNIPAAVSSVGKLGSAHPRLWYGNIVRRFLLERGYSEVYTYSFAKKGEGDIEVMNPVGKDRPYIRRDLSTGIARALAWNMYNGPVIGAEDVRIYEFGNVFRIEHGELKEHHSLVIANAPGNKKHRDEFKSEIEDLVAQIPRVVGLEKSIAPDEVTFQTLPANPTTLKCGGYIAEIHFDALIANLPIPKGYESIVVERDVQYRPVSPFPFIVRDISLFVPVSVPESEIEQVLKKDAGDLVVRCSCFDRFQREGDPRVSYAFRFVFQSFERTLTDEEVNAAMERVYAAARSKGWETR